MKIHEYQGKEILRQLGVLTTRNPEKIGCMMQKAQKGY
jgi:succinyl-CoA synthetase beta subunit